MLQCLHQLLSDAVLPCHGCCRWSETVQSITASLMGANPFRSPLRGARGIWRREAAVRLGVLVAWALLCQGGDECIDINIEISYPDWMSDYMHYQSRLNRR